MKKPNPVGRPEVSYETKMVRVPVPCLDAVKKLIKKYKDGIK